MRKALAHLRNADPRMGKLISEIGPYRIAFSPADFSTLVRCIVYQQLSGKAASRIYRRIEEALGPGKVTPKAVLNIDPPILRELGLSRQKIACIRGFAGACDTGEIDFGALHKLSDAEIMRVLTARKGIGPWTVQMFLIFGLRRPDVLPTGDLGIRVAIRRVYGLNELPSPLEMERLATPWRPYATVACWYLWRSLGDGAGLDPVID